VLPDNSLSTSIFYTPLSRSEPPSLLRQAAYNAGAPLVGPAGDPEGWKVLPPVQFTGTLFNQRPVTVVCTVSQAIVAIGAQAYAMAVAHRLLSLLRYSSLSITCLTQDSLGVTAIVRHRLANTFIPDIQLPRRPSSGSAMHFICCEVPPRARETNRLPCDCTRRNRTEQ
jgi:hypothetical protein